LVPPYLGDKSQGAALFKSQLSVFPLALAGAVKDAARAWAIAPLRHTHSLFDVKAGGGWKIRSRRGFSGREIFRLKRQFCKLVFMRSLRIRLAKQIVVPRDPTEGLLTNFLHVIEVVHRVRPDAVIGIDWALNGKEVGFKYGAVGDNVWTKLFCSVGEDPPATAYRADASIDLALWGTGKDYLTGARLRAHRRAYHKTLSNWIKISNPAVLERVRHTREESFKGRFCLGVHRRVGNVMVANLQSDGAVPSLDSLIEHCRSILQSESRESVIFLATDDLEAVDAFASAFSGRLIIQEGVQRTTADKAEVHFQGWNKLSLSDAEDVLTDTLLLSHCHVLLHGSSAISTVASLLNPQLELVRVFGRAPAKNTA
jgi:hypothetical protein